VDGPVAPQRELLPRLQAGGSLRPPLSPPRLASALDVRQRLVASPGSAALSGKCVRLMRTNTKIRAPRHAATSERPGEPRPASPCVLRSREHSFRKDLLTRPIPCSFILLDREFAPERNKQQIQTTDPMMTQLKKQMQEPWFKNPPDRCRLVCRLGRLQLAARVIKPAYVQAVQGVRCLAAQLPQALR
jgi:hypothetical protein